MDVILVRLRKEAAHKCSLTPLRRRRDRPWRWVRCDPGQSIDVGEVTLLHPDGELLTPADAARPLLLVDASWRDLPGVVRGLRGTLHPRRLPPGLVTAYPRRSATFADPAAGLASIEALHAALALLGARDDGLLEGYHWAAEWLARNGGLLESPRHGRAGPHPEHRHLRAH